MFLFIINLLSSVVSENRILISFCYMPFTVELKIKTSGKMETYVTEIVSVMVREGSEQ